jgi:carboxyl-terminal processing protease
MLNRHKKRIWAFSAALLMMLAISSATHTSRYFEIAKSLTLFSGVYKEVNSYYVDEVNPTKLLKTGVDAMLQSLDPYTNYYPEDQIEDFRTMMTGQYAGIGASIMLKNNRNTIQITEDEVSAFKAGIRTGDEILEINGLDVSSRDAVEVEQLLNGQANSKVNLKVRRQGVQEPLEFEVVREKINIKNVPYYGMVDNQIGYVQLTGFTQTATDEVKRALIDLKSKGLKKLILDVRGNPGGLLTEAVNISNLFIPKDTEVVSTKGKAPGMNTVYRSLNEPFDAEIPVAVLINSKSASAAEIVSGVIQDYDRGVLVGQRTYGKGLVQVTRPLSYNSQLKVTTSRYYIPSGRCIQAIDYSIKNEDGSVAMIPDSLREAFMTRNKRTVYDGGGVSPDVEVEEPQLKPITQSLISKGLIFDYATLYSQRHESIRRPRDFRLSDAEYNDFVMWLADKEYDYITKVETQLEMLEVNAKKEKYYPGIKDRLESLKAKVTHNKEQDLSKNKAEIKGLLEKEIVGRYYLHKGNVEYGFDTDPDVQTALHTLKDEVVYRNILKGK